MLFSSMRFLKRTLLVSLLLLLSVTIVTNKPALAQSNITVERTEVWIDFPEKIDFQIVASAPALITEVTLEYGLQQALTCGDVSTLVQPEFTPATTLDLTWRWNLLSSGIVPPGTNFWWRWHLTLEDGTTVTTETETAQFIDNWYVWQSVSDDNITVYWYRGGEEIGQAGLQAARSATEDLARDTGLRLTDPIQVYLYEESRDLQISLPGAPAWAGGVAFPDQNIVMGVLNQGFLDYGLATVRHEIGHLVIGRLTFNCVGNLPRWLDEGLAQVAEGTPDANGVALLDSAVAADQLLTIQQIESAFSIHRDRAQLSYAQSYSIVRYLIDSYGQDQMLTFLNTFVEGVTVDEALARSYGLDMPTLEAEWRAYIGAGVRLAENEAVGPPTPIATLSLGNVAVAEVVVDSAETATVVAAPAGALTQPDQATPSPQPEIINHPTATLPALTNNSSSTDSGGNGLLIAIGVIVAAAAILAIFLISRRKNA